MQRWTSSRAAPGAALLLLLFAGTILSGQTHTVRSLKVTVLSTMLAGDPGFKGIGEWGFAALIEADGRRLLFDTGERPLTVLENAREIGVDLSGITDVILTHNHWDHVGGLVTLRRAFGPRDARAFSRTHVATGIFLSRPSPSDGSETNGLLPFRQLYEETGGAFIVHGAPAEIAPGVWFSGPVPRVNDEKNYAPGGRMLENGRVVADTLPEDAAVVINTTDGIVVIAGCGHAGIINTAEAARAIVPGRPVHAVIGGLHLLAASDSTVSWTASRFREFGVTHLLAAHCTGLEATYRLRSDAGLSPRTAVVAAVGSSFTLGTGITPLLLSAAPIRPDKGMPDMTSEEFANVLRDIAATWTTNDAQGAAALFHDDAVYEEPPKQQFYRGRQDILAFFEKVMTGGVPLRMTWHNAAFDPQTQVGFGEYTFARLKQFHGIVTIQMKDGLIYRWREYQYPSDLPWEGFSGESSFRTFE